MLGFFRHFVCVFVFVFVFVIVFVFVFVSSYDFWIVFIISFQNMYGYRGLWSPRADILIIFELMTDKHSPIPLIDSAHPGGWAEWKWLSSPKYFQNCPAPPRAAPRNESAWIMLWFRFQCSNITHLFWESKTFWQYQYNTPGVIICFLLWRIYFLYFQKKIKKLKRSIFFPHFPKIWHFKRWSNVIDKYLNKKNITQTCRPKIRKHDQQVQLSFYSCSRNHVYSQTFCSPTLSLPITFVLRNKRIKPKGFDLFVINQFYLHYLQKSKFLSLILICSQILSH